MTNRRFDICLQMREDLMKAYREVYSTCRTQREAYQKTVKHPAPRFYFTPKQVYGQLRLMVTGDFSQVEKLRPSRRKMYMELFERLQEMMQRKEYIGKSLWFICQFVVAQPASEFYISEHTFKDIFPYLKKYGKEYRFKEIRKGYGAEKLSDKTDS